MCTSVCVQSVLSVPDRFPSPDFKIVIPLRISCVMAQSLLFITALLSEPLAVLQPCKPFHLPLPSPSVCLLPALFLCQLQPVGGIKSQRCRGNLSYPYRLNRSFLDHCLAASQTLRNKHPLTTNTGFFK